MAKSSKDDLDAAMKSGATAWVKIPAGKYTHNTVFLWIRAEIIRDGFSYDVATETARKLLKI